MIATIQRLGATPPTAVAPPVANVLPSVDTNVTFYPSPGNLETYYRDLHAYILKLNDMVASAEHKPCFTDADLQLWRAYRDSWVEFYSAGPSQWFTWFKDDVSRAQAFHSRALQWEAFVVGRCKIQPLPVTARPLGTPATFGDAIVSLFSSVAQGVTTAVTTAVNTAGQNLSDSTKRTLGYVGIGVIGLAALYVGVRIWRG